VIRERAAVEKLATTMAYIALAQDLAGEEVGRPCWLPMSSARIAMGHAALR
jgi:hypothetical protein